MQPRRDDTLIGVPTSAGTHGIGQDKAPQLRRADLVGRLLEAGLDLTGDGDLPLALYLSRSPDRHHQTLDLVVTGAQRVADRVERVARLHWYVNSLFLVDRAIDHTAAQIIAESARFAVVRARRR